MGLPWTCVLHFLVVENRALYLFYGAFKSFAVKIAVASEMKRQLGNEDAEDWASKACIKEENVEAKVNCVREGVEKALWTLYISEDNATDCYRAGEVGYSFVGGMHLSALVLCSSFLLVSLAMLLRSGAEDWRQGRYMCFTWGLEKRPAYRAVAGVLLGFTICALGLTLWDSHRFAEQGLFLQPMQVVMLTWSDMLALCGAAYAFLVTTDPAFDWEDQAILDATYERGWLSLVTQSNDAFGGQLEHAMMLGKLGKLDELEGLLGPDRDHPLLQANKPPPVIEQEQEELQERSYFCCTTTK